jgi:hypothetical protein
MTITTKLAPLLAALTLAACGGEDPGARAGRDDAAFEGAVKFARCMREHGVDLPDPQRAGNGMVRIGGPDVAIDPDDPRVRRAEGACRKHMEAGGGPAPSPQQQAELRDAFTRYARCMRAAGVDVPDPRPGEAGIVVRRGQRGAPDPESPAYRAADARCNDLLADIEGTLEGGR